MDTETLKNAVKDRFKEFLKEAKLSEVAKITGCQYTVVHNLSKGKHAPSLETIFNFKLGYGNEFDEVYMLTGKKAATGEKIIESTQSISDSEKITLYERLLSLGERLEEKDKQIQELLRQDRDFLQSQLERQGQS
jgi:hypothetical protein